MDPSCLQCLTQQQGAQNCDQTSSSWSSRVAPISSDNRSPDYILNYLTWIWSLPQTAENHIDYSYCHSTLEEGHKHRLLIGFSLQALVGCSHLRWIHQDDVASRNGWPLRCPGPGVSPQCLLLLQHLWASCLKTLLTSVLCFDPSKPAELHPQIKRQGGQWTCLCVTMTIVNGHGWTASGFNHKISSLLMNFVSTVWFFRVCVIPWAYTEKFQACV